MTCVAGLVHAGVVYLGADSAATAGTQISSRLDPKVFQIGDYAFGFAVSFRMGQLLHHTFKPPTPKPREPLDKFMATRFVESMRACLKDGSYTSIEDDDSSLLVGYRGRLFNVGSDFQVGEPIDKYDAIGSGDDAALGSLFATQRLPPQRRLEIALSAAEHFSNAVRAPFRFVNTPPPKKPRRRR